MADPGRLVDFFRSVRWALFLSVAVAAFLHAASSGFGSEVLPAFEHGGKRYTNAVPDKVTPIDVLFRDSAAGYVRIKRMDMPDSLRDRFPYDEAEAEAYQQKLVDSRQGTGGQGAPSSKCLENIGAADL